MKEHKINIRNVITQDIPFLLHVFERSVRQTCTSDYSSQQIEAWVKKGLDEERWRERIKTHYFIVAETADSGIMGFSSLTEEAYLDVLFVAPEFQGRKIASSLVDKIKTKAISSGRKRISTHASITARPFFEQQGFRIAEENTRYLFDIPIMNYHMIWVS